MWFVFGLVTLVGSCVLMGIRRYQANWSGILVDGLQIKVAQNTKTEQIQSVAVGLSTATALDFELKPETWVDRACKVIGLSREFQIGSDRFDRQMYLVSDDERIAELLQRDSLLVERLLLLSSERLPVRYRFHRLICRAGLLRAEFRVQHETTDSHALTSWLRKPMRDIAERLPDQLLQSEPTRDPYFLRSVIVLAASSGLAINGGLQLLRVGMSHIPFTVDHARLWSLGAVLGSILVGLLVAATIVLLGRTSRAHLVLLEIVLVGSFGALTTAVTEVRDFNIEADTGAAQALQSMVLDRRIHRGRRGRRSYSLTLQSWNGGRSERVRVTHADYDHFPVGTPVTVSQRPGRLGIRWVESLERR